MRTFARWLRRASRNLELTWRLYNLAPAIAYRRQQRRPAGEATRVAQELQDKGIAISSVSALLEDASCFDQLRREVAQQELALADQMQACRAAANDHHASGPKPYLFQMLGEHPVMDRDSIFARFALQNPIRDVANAYFGMYVRLRYYNVWYNFVTDREACQSQLWHRDPEDRYILKVFLYLVPVNDDNGPFTYAPGTHMKGNCRRRPAYLHKDGYTTRSDDRQMSAVVPQQQWVTCTGPAGTLVFADTRGYHKGGLARVRDRIVYTCEFISLAGGASGISTLDIS
jgi:hypothetical protein